MESEDSRAYTATCRTDGCFNGGVGIDMVGLGESVECGVCGQPITDIEFLPAKEENEDD